jgi:hypothetical protein
MFNRKRETLATSFDPAEEYARGYASMAEYLERQQRDREFLTDLMLAVGLGVLVLVDVLTSGRR